LLCRWPTTAERQAAALAALEKQAAEAASAKEELSLVEEAKIEEKIGVADAMKGENAEVPVTKRRRVSQQLGDASSSMYALCPAA
jgi:hypothetical protein